MKQTYENYYRDYYQKNKKKIQEKRRTKWKEKISQRKKEHYEEIKNSYDREYSMWYSAKKRAEEKSLPFDIAPEDIVIPEYCPILGIKLSSERSQKTRMTAPSLDRIIPSLGYVKGNVKVISGKANTMKRDLDLETIEKIKNYILESTSSV